MTPPSPPETRTSEPARRPAAPPPGPTRTARTQRPSRLRGVWLGAAGAVLLAVAVVALDPAGPTRYGGALAAVWGSGTASAPTSAATPRAHAGRRPASLYRGSLSPRGGAVLGMRLHQLSARRLPLVPVTVPLRPGVRGVDSESLTYDGINYADPTASGVPLQWVGDEEDTWLTPGFTLRDFAPRDGASMARVDPTLVAGLERLRLRAGRVAIVSGYRHPSHNVAVGGTGHSLHTAGKAADVWSPDHDPLALARLALLTMGCDVGVGLGPRTVHVDVRGELTTWTYEGAPLSGPAFDAWALTQCGRPVPPALAQAAAAAWLDDSTAVTPPSPDAPSAPAAGAPPATSIDHYAEAVGDAARRGRTQEGAGGVVVDVTAGPAPTIRYVRASSPEAAALGLTPLISWCTARGSDSYVAYALVTAEGVSTGIANVGVGSAGGALGLRPAPASPAPSPTSSPPPPAEALSSAPTGASDGAEAEWAVVLASLQTRAAARERADAVRGRVGHVGPVSVVAAPEVGRYRVTVGPYPSPTLAQRALDALGDVASEDAWVLAL